MKIKSIIWLIFVFIFINTLTYTYTKANLDSRIKYVLDQDLNNLITHYKILNKTQQNIAHAIQKSILTNTDAIEILEKSFDASKEVQSKNRAQLLEQLKGQYETAKRQGVLQMQLVFKDNNTFLRVQKPEKFGDSLNGIRKDYEYVHQYKKPMRAFVQGKMAHGFRNTFPIFNKNDEYIGAIEISFSSESYQWYLDEISYIHSHFLVNKNIIEIKTGGSEDWILTYDKSSENEDFLISITPEHTKEECIVENLKRIKSIKQDINKKMFEYKPFAIKFQYKGKIFTISLYPIENIDNKKLAWIVGYKESPLIESVIKNTNNIRFFGFLISLLIIYFLIREIKSKQKLIKQNDDISKQHNFLNEILNTTPDIMVITDFNDVKFSNDKFRKFFNVNRTQQFNDINEHQFIDLFIQTDGYLSKKDLREGEDFASLVNRTPDKDRIVSVQNENNQIFTFTISVTNSKNDGDYLVTLSDITKLQEHHQGNEKKANYDSLTNIYNRQKFDEIFAQKIKNTERYSYPLSLAIFDIDKFKLFNDTYGHLLGDEVLISTTQVVQNNLRDTDIFARWGGEEFVILFTHTSLPEAEIVSEKLRKLIEENSHPTAGKITVSFGLTQYVKHDTQQSMFKRCDEALYMAKSNGRNKVMIKTGEKH